MDIPRGVGLTVTTTEAPPDEVPSRGATACTLTDSVYVNVVSEPSAGGTSSAAPTLPSSPLSEGGQRTPISSSGGDAHGPAGAGTALEV